MGKDSVELYKGKENSVPVPVSSSESDELFRDGLAIETDGNEYLEAKLNSEEQLYPTDCHFYKIKELTFEKDLPRREVFENVIASLNNPNFNFVYFLSGNAAGVSIYLGVVENYRKPNLSGIESYDVAHALIQSLKGNFMGTKAEALGKDEIRKEIFEVIEKSKRKSFVYGVPSVTEDNTGEINNFQGVDRLINSMLGETFQLMVVCEPVEKQEVVATLKNVYDYYNLLTRDAEQDYSANRSETKTENTQTGSSTSKSKNKGVNRSHSNGHSSRSGDNWNVSKGTSSGTSESASENKSFSTGNSYQLGDSLSYKLMNKQLKEQIEYIDEEFLPRLKLGKAKGLFRAAVYAMSNNNATLEKLEGNIRSIFQGNKTTFSTMDAAKLFNAHQDSQSVTSRISRLLSHFQIYDTKISAQPEMYLLSGVDITTSYARLASLMNPSELSLIGGLPQSEVPGIKLNEAVDFGVNVTNPPSGFELGYILHRGNETQNRVTIDKEVLKKHIFITGVTGSGKTTTCQKILLEAGMPFLVIEPAKTEYRQLYKDRKDIIYYTVGRNDLCPFRLNPLELIKGENLSSHIDLLMATFQAIYPMEAAIPFLLKEAIISCYEKLGWSLDANENRYTDDPWNAQGLFWPNVTNLVAELNTVVERKHFANELKQNYIGSMVARFNDLTLGTRGSIFNVPCSIDFEKLIQQNVVIELEEIKNEEDKVLLMGLILTRLSESVKKAHKADRNFRHITLVEEAHRLLAKAEPGEQGKKLGIQTFTDMLAEIRKYGESLIIVDQIPGKLTPEIIKNTNTKIVHKLFAEDDKKAMAHTIALDEKQMKYLSSLNTGEAIVYTEGWHKAVGIKVSALSNIAPVEINESEIAAVGRRLIKENISLFFPYFSGYDLTENQIDFLLRKKSSWVKKLWSYFKTPDEDSLEPFIATTKEMFSQLFEYFPFNRELCFALAKEFLFYLKIYLPEGSFDREMEKYTEALAGTISLMAETGLWDSEEKSANSAVRQLAHKSIIF